MSASIAALEAEVAGLRKALQNRTVIGQATGLIAARTPCTPHQAFELLVQLSQHHNIKLHIAARRLVTAFVTAHLGNPVAPADQALWDYLTTANESGGTTTAMSDGENDTDGDANTTSEAGT
ncbi:ANTAR domain-containing protein [Lentzea tibetensis]|uniref:ANTAR domain-containing protein n=1 Tax=Lentzea tibetensis TaxID=2591470 RepID=UPI001F1DC8F1|nr:ANTAR domain-containing protein [Lentzea tibetensis]